jgi:hypothetical protein
MATILQLNDIDGHALLALSCAEADRFAKALQELEIANQRDREAKLPAMNPPEYGSPPFGDMYSGRVYLLRKAGAR